MISCLKIGGETAGEKLFRNPVLYIHILLFTDITLTTFIHFLSDVTFQFCG